MADSFGGNVMSQEDDSDKRMKKTTRLPDEQKQPHDWMQTTVWVRGLAVFMRLKSRFEVSAERAGSLNRLCGQSVGSWKLSSHR